MKNGVLAANIAALRKYLGLKQEAFAEKLGATQPQASKWESKGMEPGPRLLARMAQLAGCSVEEFIDTPWEPPEPAPLSADIPPSRSADAGDTAPVIRLDLSLPMGSGATVDDYIEEEPLLFDLGYLRSFTRTPAARLRLARGVGDSMMPTLLPGDAVWIDSTQTMLNQSDKVWAVSINGGAAIKRLRPLRGGKVLIISDNKTIGDYEVDADEIMIGGRVIKFEREL